MFGVGIGVVVSPVLDMGSLGLTPGGSPFRLTTWNAHSVYNKRPEIESLFDTQSLDVLGVTESLWGLSLC